MMRAALDASSPVARALQRLMRLPGRVHRILDDADESTDRPAAPDGAAYAPANGCTHKNDAALARAICDAVAAAPLWFTLSWQLRHLSNATALRRVLAELVRTGALLNPWRSNGNGAVFVAVNRMPPLWWRTNTISPGSQPGIVWQRLANMGDAVGVGDLSAIMLETVAAGADTDPQTADWLRAVAGPAGIRDSGVNIARALVYAGLLKQTQRAPTAIWRLTPLARGIISDASLIEAGK